MRQGDVGDGGIEHLHEGGEGDRDGDEPGVMGRAPEGTVRKVTRWKPEPRLPCLADCCIIYMHVCICKAGGESGAYRDETECCKTIRNASGAASSGAGRARSRQQERTDATRRKLLAAAEQIFARSGFEAARLEDIASEAGYTRGRVLREFRQQGRYFLYAAGRMGDGHDWITWRRACRCMRDARRVPGAAATLCGDCQGPAAGAALAGI